MCREQYPVVVAEGMTVHKSQGQTLNTVTIDFNGKNMKRCILYVALSRATSLSGLHMLQKEFVIPSKPKPTDPVVVEMKRLREESQFVPIFQHLRDSEAGCVKLVSFNVQSLNRHLPSIVADQIFVKSEILLLQETWGIWQKEYPIPNMTEVVANKFKGQPKAKGTSIYVTTSLFENIESIDLKEIEDSKKHIEITMCTFKDIDIINVYKNPGATIDMLETILSDYSDFIQSSNNIIIAGDFNENLVKSSGLQSFMKNTFNLEIFSPMSSTTDGNTTIDAIFGRLSDYTIKTYIYESYFSYRKPIVCKIFSKNL